MPETLLSPALMSQPNIEHETIDKNLLTERRVLVDSMVQQRLVSEEFSRSGALDDFSIDETLGRDALSHILIGDDYGGGHHLPTIIELGVDGRQVASTVINPDNPNKNRAYYRGAQRVKENGVFTPKIFNITDSLGRVLEKTSGSNFFPNEWTTQEVLEAIVETSKQPGEHNPDRRAYIHNSEVNGVRVIVNTDDFTGKIVAARPGRK